MPRNESKTVHVDMILGRENSKKLNFL